MKARPSAPTTLAAKIVDRVIPHIDTDGLAETIGAKLSEQILSSLKIDSIVSTLMEKYSTEVEEAITSAIIEQM